MTSEQQDLGAGCTLGELVEALYDEMLDLSVSEPAKTALAALMLGDIMREKGRQVVFEALPGRKAHRREAA